jgi:hypothetical protein
LYEKNDTFGKNDQHSGRKYLAEIRETSPQARKNKRQANMETEHSDIKNSEDGSYENYTLIELIDILFDTPFRRDCPWNKKAIIEMIQEENMNVPKKLELEPTKWEHYRIRHSLDVLQTPLFDIYEGCIIELEDGSRWDIDISNDQILKSEDLPKDDYNSWEDVIYVYLEGPDDEIQMTVEEFIHMLDHDDVTLLQVRDCNYFMSVEQENYWKNYVRMM